MLPPVINQNQKYFIDPQGETAHVTAALIQKS